MDCKSRAARSRHSVCRDPAGAARDLASSPSATALPARPHGEQRALEACQTKPVTFSQGESCAPESWRGTAAKRVAAQEFGSNAAQCGCGLPWESDDVRSESRVGPKSANSRHSDARRCRVLPSLNICPCATGTRLGHAYGQATVERIRMSQSHGQPLFVSRDSFWTRVSLCLDSRRSRLGL
jgi:hypothetical protein